MLHFAKLIDIVNRKRQSILILIYHLVAFESPAFWLVYHLVASVSQTFKHRQSTCAGWGQKHSVYHLVAFEFVSSHSEISVCSALLTHSGNCHKRNCSSCGSVTPLATRKHCSPFGGIVLVVTDTDWFRTPWKIETLRASWLTIRWLACLQCFILRRPVSKW